MIPGARLIILGRQGAGKGTQCVRLSWHFVVPHISTGDILRVAVRERTPLGVEAKAVMDGGGLVGDAIMVGIVRERLDRDDARTCGYILDGFPRTVVQAEALDEITAERPIDAVIDLDVPRPLVLQRLSAVPGVCRDCGTNYMATGTERQPWICDVCGGDVMIRDDDTPDAINRRLDLYEQQTEPLIAFYERTGRLAVVDGVATPDQVFARLTTAVEAPAAQLMRGRHRPLVQRSAAELVHMRAAGKVVAEMHDVIRAAARPGVTTGQLDGLAREVLARRDATSNFLGYHGYPAVICASVNDELVHGIPGERVLLDGDLLSIDCGAVINGWHGDAAFSMPIGTASPATTRPIAAADAALAAAIAAMVPGGHLGDIGAVVDSVVSKAGFGSPHDYCGHGIGRAMHEEPDVENRGKRGKGPELTVGVVLAIEPMLIGGGKDDVDELDDGWTVVTADGSYAAHTEHTVLVGPNGPEILTS